MRTEPHDDWHEANQRYLMAALAVVRSTLDRHVARANDAPEPEDRDEPKEEANQGFLARILAFFGIRPKRNGVHAHSTTVTEASKMETSEAEERDEPTRELQESRNAMPAPPALETLSEMFSLTPFERDLLLLCAGMELDSNFAALCASAQRDPRRAYPTFRLALATMPGAHWSALVPAAPLRRWRLIEVGAGDALTTAPLRIDERVLHYLTGVFYLDERLQGLVEPQLPPSGELPLSHQALVQRIVGLWSRTEDTLGGTGIQLRGDEDASKHEIAAAASAALGLRLHMIRAADVPAAATEREGLERLWEREAVLSGSALLLEYQDLDSADSLRPALSLLEDWQGKLILSGRQPLDTGQRSVIRLDVNKPTAAEQRDLWKRALGPLAPELNGQIEALTTQFDLDAQGIRAASVEALEDLSRGRKEEPGVVLWEACRAQSRPRLGELAQRIEPFAEWDDLVLPAPQHQILRDVATHVRQRARVYGTWGFAAKGGRGLGISALFAGASGTGKTMAAEVLANELRLDLYRIDLSQVVSKYIGETEKNLKRVFDTAEEGGAILLFDEADALFGKRTEIKDSHDRYANIEVSYLLQRMEAYRGLAVLTTNMKNALDTAFMRRIRFIVHFPFPDAGQRAEIWRHIFPSGTPTEGLDANKLARLNVAGGNIRNIALNAAFLAADAGEPVRMEHLLRAARSEYAKLEKPLTEAEIGGWS